MNKFLKLTFSILLVLTFSFCSTNSTTSLPENFNNCEISLEDALNKLQEIKSTNELIFDVRIVREITNREECIDMVLGTNLPQGAELANGQLVDLVVGIKEDKVTESVKASEYDLYIQQLEEKSIEKLNLISAPLFGNAVVDQLIDNQNLVTYIKSNNPMNYRFMFSEAEGFIYGVDSNLDVVKILDLSEKTIREKEAGLHTFDFINLENKNYLIVTYSSTDNKYKMSAFEILSDFQLGNETNLISFDLQNDNNVHFGGKILQANNNLLLCLGDLNSPGNSAKFDSPWGKILNIEVDDILNSPITSHDDSRIGYIAYGLRNPWSCFFDQVNLVVPDVGNIHWEEINILPNFSETSDPYFMGWPWYESFFDANYQNTPVDADVKNQQIENTFFPSFLYPHSNDYCAIIGGTNLTDSPKWNGYFFVGDFCTGTIWAINTEKNSQLIVLEKNIIPYSITTINDSENGTLLVGTTSGTILELTLP